MKVNIGLSLIGIVIGEMIGSKTGAWIFDYLLSQIFQLTTMIMAIVILCMIAILLYGAISLLQKYYFKRHQ